jgi:hypothetical protein
MAEIEVQGKCRGDQTDSDPLARSANKPARSTALKHRRAEAYKRTPLVV